MLLRKVVTIRPESVMLGGKRLAVDQNGDVVFAPEDLDAFDIIPRVMKMVTREFSGAADHRIVPPRYAQGITLAQAKNERGKTKDQTLYDFLYDLNFMTIGLAALRLIFRKQSFAGDANRGRRSFVTQKYFKIMDALKSNFFLDSLTPPQLGRVVYFIIEQLTGDADPHSEYDAETVAAFDEIYPALVDKINEPGFGAIQWDVAYQLQGKIFKSFVYAALSGATDITFFGLKKPVRQVANDLDIAVPETLNFSNPEAVSAFLDRLAVDSSYQDEVLPWRREDIIPVKLLKLMISIVERDPEGKIEEDQAFEAWMDLVTTRANQPIILRVDDKEDFVVVQLKLRALLVAGFPVAVVGSEKPIMNDATASWLKERLSSDPLFSGYLAKEMLQVFSTGTGTGGTDLANTSEGFNELALESSSIISEGSTNRESLIQAEPLRIPVITALMTGKDGIKVQFLFQ